MQIKLFELLDGDRVLKQLKELFGNDSVICFSNKIVGISYDYGANNYVQILKKVKKLDLRQVIVTSTSFLNLINICVGEDIQLNYIKFIYPISPDSVNYVDEYIELINASSGENKNIAKTNLFKEIDWITSDECIDIKCISFDIQDDINIYYKVELFNNGVLLVNDRSILKQVKRLINNLF